MPALSQAVPITFTVRFAADTDDVSYFAGISPLYSNLSGQVEFSDGVNLSFDGAYVFNKRDNGTVGFGVGLDLFDMSDASLFSYDRITSFGPMSTNNISALYQWTFLDTSAGVLSVSSVVSGTFEAELDSAPVPEPGSIALVALGLAGVAAMRKRARR